MDERNGKAVLKIPGGKLIIAKVTYGKSIKRAELTGDFFIYPEEGLETIESALEGLAADLDEKEMAIAVQSAIDSIGVQTIGVDAISIAKVVKEAIGR